MIQIGSEQIASMFVGDMGIKLAYAGNEQLYNRESSYVYIRLSTNQTSEGE